MIFIFAVFPGCGERTIPAADEIDNSTGFNRIISAAPSITEIIAGLGFADKLIAVDMYSLDIQGVRDDLPMIDFFFPDIEAIAALNPDLIISGEINAAGSSESQFEFLTRFGVRIEQIPTSNSINDIYHDITYIAGILGVEERGEKLIRDMRNHIETISAAARSTLAGAMGKTVYFEIAPAPIIVSFGRGTYLHELIEIIGARNIFDAEERWFTPNAEAIIRANPDIIFILDGESGSAISGSGLSHQAELYIAEIKSRPGFNAISAVQFNRIYPINENHASRPSQNIVLALETMYRNLYH